MHPAGVRMRASILAVLAVSIAVVVGTIVLITTLRGSLVEEVDRANLSRADDIATQWFSENELIVLGAGFDNATFAAVFDSTGFYEFTDSSAEIDSLLAFIPEFGEAFDGALPLDETIGSDNVRSIALWADDPDGIEGKTIDDLEPSDPIILVATSLDPVDETVRDVLVGALILGPVFVLLVGVLTWVLTGRSLQPVEDIRREVETISSSDLDRRVPVPGTADEIERLAATMNDMLGRLQRSHETQQVFVADASHELRSPLASMSAILDVAKRHGTDDEWPETAADLKRETNRMRRLVDDLLLLARADSASIAMATELVDLDDLVLDAVLSLPETVRGKVDTTGVSAGLVRGNRDQLQRVMINLVDNALRHAREHVRVQVVEVDGRVVITVADDGPGIPLELREAIFDRFTRLDDARSRDAGGSGLGLAITREIIMAHEGTISVADAPSGGAEFTVSLPSHS